MLGLQQAGSVCGASAHADSCLTLKPLILDDVNKGIHDPSRGAANLQQLAADRSVLGVIGPLYDSLARSEIPVANQAGLPLISPANSDVCLTQEPPDGHCEGLSAKFHQHGRNAFFRVVTTVLSEGPAAGDFAYSTLGKRHAFVVDDSSWLGHGLGATFSARFIRHGGKLATDEAAADLVYFPSGDLPAVAAMRRTITASSPQVPLLGNDSLASAQYALASGAAARDSYYTLVGPFPSATRSASRFVAAYQRRYQRDPTTTDLAAFDATGVLLNAIARAIDDSGGGVPNRAQVLTELARTSGYSGAMGTFGFDQRGDTSLKWVSLYQWLASTDRAGRFTAQIAVP